MNEKMKSTWRILWIVGSDKEAGKIGLEMDVRQDLLKKKKAEVAYHSEFT